MRRTTLLILAALCLTVWSAVFFLLRAETGAAHAVIPTQLVLPSLTPTHPPPSPAPPTVTPPPSPTATSRPTETPVPTPSPTLSARLLSIVAIMPGVVMPPPTDPPPDLTLISAPPPPVEPLPEATRAMPPFIGWHVFESDYPTVHYAPPWTPRLAPFASRGQYHRTETADSTASFPFAGAALRVRYIAAPNMGLFDLIVDGVVLDTIDAYADALSSPTTPVYIVGDGAHWLEIRATGRRNRASTGHVVGLDAIHVWRGAAHTRLVTPTPPPTASPTPRPAQIERVSAPPTVQPTGTPVPPRVLTAEILIAYDENGNRAVDPAEGVAGISVRLVETNTNRVIASGFTDERGYASFAVVSDTPTQIVVPYFGRTWPLQRSGGPAAPAFTLLLTPGNQPGLIP
ncbi:MAG: hypothetical protein ACUVS2_16800 [Candidatus Flexifilum sp.]